MALSDQNFIRISSFGTLIALSVALLSTVTLACKNYTLESCATKEDCAGLDSLCIRDESNKLLTCSGDDKDCLCTPKGFVQPGCTESPAKDCPVLSIELVECTSDDDCPDFEVCGKSSRSGENFCVGCLAADGQRFERIDKNNNRCEVSRLACRKTYDYCSNDIPCEKGLQCISFQGSNPIECVVEGPCQCLPPTLVFKNCTSSIDCPAREDCSLNVLLNMSICVSCSAAANNQFFVLDEPGKCDSIKPFELPDYAPASNGRSFDLCREDVQCTGKRKCVEYLDVYSPANGTRPCQSSKDALCFCKGDRVSCVESSDCPLGENCADAPSLLVNKECVSVAFTATVPDPNLKVYGNREVVEGRNLTNDPCKFDWHCKRGRRCTHKNDGYGGCAGRRVCTCEPLAFPICENDSDCEDGEECVQTVGSKTDPRCVSSNEVARSDFLQPPGYVPPTTTSVPGDGYTDAPCLQDSDCSRNSLVCRHMEDWVNACDGRPFCFCKTITNGIEQTLPCSNSMKCPEGEVCTNVLDSVPSAPSCLSRYVYENNLETYEAVGLPPTSSPSPHALEPTPSDEIEDEGSPAGSVEASSPEDMETGDESSGDESSGDEANVTTSESPSTSDEPIDDGDDNQVELEEVCMDATLLNHLRSTDLVYSKSRRAAVLCDATGSCATPGHMITWQGHAMAMRTYCRLHAACQLRVMWVNSPRMRAGIRIDSRTEGLRFTALAARYETWMEEALLTRLLHLGA